MLSSSPGRLRRLPIFAALIAVAIVPPVSSASAVRKSGAQQKPTIVLVHGAFADASGFGPVTARLQRAGYTVLAPATPLRSLSGDAAYVASIIKTIAGPVVLVGHSYGGAVVTEAGTQASNVKALVYLNGFALQEGESAFDINDKFTDNLLGPALLPRPFTNADGSAGTDFYIDPAKFHDVFAGDLPARQTSLLAPAGWSRSPGNGWPPRSARSRTRWCSPAAVPRRTTRRCSESSTAPAWKVLPTWYLVAADDRAIDPAAERFMAQRANAHTKEIRSSHATYLSHPTAVAKFIIEAARRVG